MYANPFTELTSNANNVVVTRRKCWHTGWFSKQYAFHNYEQIIIQHVENSQITFINRSATL